MLVMDGHGSHLTIEFVDYCYKNRILPYLLPPHSTHLLQPLDVAVFQPFKHHHQVLLEESIRWGGTDFDRTEFLACFQQMRQLTFKEGTIRSGWEKAGLVPLNPNRVLSQMKDISAPQRQITPEEQIIDWNGELFTPEDKAEISQFTDFIELRIAMAIRGTEPISPHVGIAWEKREKAQKTEALNGILAEEELYKKREEELQRKRRKAQNRQVQIYGTITVGDARLKLVSRDTAEEERQRLQQERLEQREARQKVRQEEEKVAKEARAKAKAEKKAEKEKLKAQKKKAQEVKAAERAKIKRRKEAEKAKRALEKKRSRIKASNKSTKSTKASDKDSKTNKRIIPRVSTKGAVQKRSRG